MARYDNLTELLSGLGEKNLRVKRAVLVKFGTILLAGPKVPENSESKTGEQQNTTELERLPSDVAARIYDALKDHPNIFEPKKLLEREEGASGSRLGFFVTGSFYHYQVHLPKAKQAYKDDPWDTPEQFFVVSTGSLFAAYAEIDDVPVFSNIGHEFRVLAREQIAKQTPLECPNLGPCPIHPDIIIVVRDIGEDGGAVSVRRYVRDGDIFIVTSDSRPFGSLVVDRFFEFGRSLEFFYRSLLQRNYLIDSSTQMSDSFSAASAALAKLLKVPFWKFWEAHAISQQARLSVASAHQDLVALETDLLEYERDRSETLESVKKDRDATALVEYFRDMTAPDVVIPPSLTAALSFFESELQLYGNIRSLLIASLLGAVVGSLLTGLLGRLLVPVAGPH